MSLFQTIDRYITNSKRILLHSTEKPSKQEVMITSRITALGILVIGLIGYIIHNAVTALVQAF